MMNMKLDVRSEFEDELALPRVKIYSAYSPLCTRFLRALQAVVAALAFAARPSLDNPKETAESTLKEGS